MLMEERILVYKDSVEYDGTIKRYQWFAKMMQELADGLKKLNVEPTITLIKRLIKGEDLRALIASKHVSESFENMPKTMQNAIQEMFKKENEADYKELIEEKAARIGNVLGKGEYPINLSFFDLKDGEIVLSPDHIKETESRCCVFIDTPGKEAVYKKWLQLVEAMRQFDEAVKNAAKIEVSEFQRHSGIDPDYLQAVAVPGRFSLAKINYEGKLVLNGENFEYIQ